MISNILFFLVHPITLIGLVISFVLWRKGKKIGAIVAVPIIWAVLAAFVTVGIFLFERSNDLNRKTYIALDRKFEININAVDVSIHFTKLIMPKKSSTYFLMANLEIDQNLTNTAIRQDCINLEFFGQKVPSATTYSSNFLHKGFESPMPAIPEKNYPLIWKIKNIDTENLEAPLITKNIKIEVDDFAPCHESREEY